MQRSIAYYPELPYLGINIPNQDNWRYFMHTSKVIWHFEERRRRRSVWHAAAAQDSDHALRYATIVIMAQPAKFSNHAAPLRVPCPPYKDSASQASSAASDAKETPAAPAPVHPLSNSRF